ncbi:hypothetical protein [Nonomuraea recticatena]|uniref:hypothetical protein n=1 Tax=Nonomuraea recticatena TaxID=46178 RepID=UPI0031F81697
MSVLDTAFQRHNHLLVPDGAVVAHAPVRPMPIVMIDVLVQDRAQMPFTVDQQSTPLAPCGSCALHSSSPSAFVTALQHGDARGREDIIEDTGEFGVPIADEEAERRRSLAKVDQELMGLLCGPCAGRTGRHPQDAHTPRADLHHRQHVHALRKDRVNVEEVAGYKSFALMEPAEWASCPVAGSRWPRQGWSSDTTQPRPHPHPRHRASELETWKILTRLRCHPTPHDYKRSRGPRSQTVEDARAAQDENA